LYTARMIVEKVSNFMDVQRFYILLKTMTNNTPHFRLIRVGKKKLPSTVDHKNFWCLIEEVSSSLSSLTELNGKTPNNPSDRAIQPARIVAEGVYSLVLCHQRTHLAYALQLPKNLGEVQKAFNIELETNLVLTVKNPELSKPSQPISNESGNVSGNTSGNVSGNVSGTTSGTYFSQSTVLTKIPSPHFQKLFEGRGWISLFPIELLNYKGIEIILSAESTNLEELRKIGQQIEEESQKTTSEYLKLLEEFQIPTEKFNEEPIITKEWM